MNNSTKTNLLLASTICFMSTSLFAQPAAIDIGELKFTPTINISNSYNDNFLYRENNEKSSRITSVNPNFVLEGEQENATYQLNYGLDRGIYHSSSDDNYLDHSLAAVVNLIGNSRNRVNLNAGYDKGHEARGEETGGSFSITNKPLEFDLKTLGAIYTYGGLRAKGRIELQGQYIDQKYTNFRNITETRDYSEIGVGATFFYRATSKTSALIEVTRSNIDYDFSNRDNTNTRALVGLAWDANAKTTGIVRVGWSELEYDDSALQGTGDVTWDGTIIWNPKTYSTFTVTFGQEFANANTNDLFIDTESFGVNWSHFWNDRLESTVELETLIEDYSDSPRKDTTNNFTIGLNYGIKRWLNLGIAYTLDDRDSNALLPRSYQSNEVTFSLQASL